MMDLHREIAQEINTTHLKPGDYVISIFFEGKVIHQQRIVISK